MDDQIARYLAPFAHTEPALTAVLAASLQDSFNGGGTRHEALFEAVLSAPGGQDKADETIRRLRRADDVEVVIEGWLSNAGNLDLAIQSRAENAILAIESKTGSTLGPGQLSKYRLALRDSDPYRRGAEGTRRAFCTVLLRPEPEPANLGKDIDHQHDPGGFEASVVVTWADLRGAVPSPGEALLARPFFVREALVRLDELADSGRSALKVPTAEARPREDLLDRIARALDPAWGPEREGFRLKMLLPCADGHWYIRVPGGQHSLITIELGKPGARRELGRKKLRRCVGLCDQARLVHLAGGWSTVGVPTPFPSFERGWIYPSEVALTAGQELRLHQQALVAKNMLLDICELMEGCGR